MSSGNQSRYPPGHHLYKKEQQQKYKLPSSQSTSKKKQSSENTSSHMDNYLKLVNKFGENLCFVNVNLQLLRSLGIFHQFFSSKVWNDHPQRRILAPILTEIELIFSSEEASANNLRSLVATKSENSSMADGEQEDMAEFLNLMLVEMGKELDSLKLSHTVLDNLMSRDKIVKKFLSEQETGVCPNCHHVPAEKYDNFNILRLPVPDIKRQSRSKRCTVSELISQHYAEKEQPGMKCPNCCKHEKNCPLTGKCAPMSYIEQRALIKSPNILIVQLMRFNPDRKIMTKVIPEDVLVLPSGERYKLVSIADHVGQPKSGHYVLQLKGVEQWSTFDDSQKYICKEPLSADNYVFGYKKLEIESLAVVPTISQTKKTSANVERTSIPQSEMSTHPRSAKDVPINKGDYTKQPKSEGKNDNVRDKNVFDVLQQNVMDRCKVCKKDTKRLLSHLNNSSKCKEQYNVDLLKQEQKERRKHYKTKHKNEKRNEQRHKDDGAHKKSMAEEKSKQREDKRFKDDGAFKRESSDEQNKVRERKRKKDDGSFKRERADEQNKVRESKRNKDEGIYKKDMAEEKSEQRKDKRNKNEGAYKKKIAEEKSKQRENKRNKDR